MRIKNYGLVLALLVCVCVFIAPIDASSQKSRYGAGEIDFLVIPAAGCSVIWYDAEVGGNIVSTSNPFTADIDATTTYYAVSVSQAGCESATRTAVTRTINPIVAAYGLSNKAVWDPIIKIASANKVFTLWGQVSVPMDPDSFHIDDGSGKPVRVNRTEHGFAAGEYVSATGMIDFSGSAPVLNCVMSRKLQ